MEQKFNPNARRISAPSFPSIYAYTDRTPGGRFRFITFNPHKAKSKRRKTEGRTCGTWSEPGSAEHRAAFLNVQRRLQLIAQEQHGRFAHTGAQPQEQSSVGFLDYLEQRRELQPHANTRRSAYAIKYARKVFDNSLKLSELKYCHFVQLKEELLANVSRETARNYTAWIKGQLTKASREFELIDRNPWAGLGISVGNYHTAPHKKQHLTREQVERLKHARTDAPNSLRAFLFACMTGVGRAEIDVLTHGDIRRNADGSGKLTVVRRKTRGHAPMTCVVPLSSSVLELVDTERSASTLLFPKLPSDQAVKSSLRNAQASVGLNRPDLTFYVGRHTFICLHIMNGTPLHMLQKMTGHASLKALMRYAVSLDLENKGYALDL